MSTTLLLADVLGYLVQLLYHFYIPPDSYFHVVSGPNFCVFKTSEPHHVLTQNLENPRHTSHFPSSAFLLTSALTTIGHKVMLSTMGLEKIYVDNFLLHTNGQTSGLQRKASIVSMAIEK